LHTKQDYRIVPLRFFSVAPFNVNFLAFFIFMASCSGTEATFLLAKVLKQIEIPQHSPLRFFDSTSLAIVREKKRLCFFFRFGEVESCELFFLLQKTLNPAKSVGCLTAYYW